MAQTLPEGKFVGVDLCEAAIAEGQVVVEELGLDNVDFICKDILKIDDELGEFDYILICGAFSWLPAEAQQRVLSICKKHLGQHGIAAIHYLTYPAWHMRMIFRDTLKQHLLDITNPKIIVKEARKFIDLLEEQVSGKQDFNSRLLHYGLKGLQSAPDGDIYHEFLPPHLTPRYLSQFIEEARGHGLQYVADAHLGHPQPAVFENHIDEKFEALKDKPIELEQLADLLSMRPGRLSVLCHEGQCLDYHKGDDPKIISSFLITSSATPAEENPDLRSFAPLEFKMDEVKSVIFTHPLVKLAFFQLFQHYPEAVPFNDLLDKARADLGREQVSRDEDLRVLGNALIRCYSNAIVNFHAFPLPVVRRVSEYPMAGPLARFMAASPEKMPRLRKLTENENSVTVVNLLHSMLALSRPMARLLCKLDGTRNRAALQEELAEIVRSEPAAVASAEMLESALQSFARNGLLCS